MSQIRSRALDAVIIGSGPAGLTAGIYLGRGQKAPVILTGPQLGGQLSIMAEIENYPGFPEPVAGYQLLTATKQQAERVGAILINESVVAVDLSQTPYRLWTQTPAAAAEILALETHLYQEQKIRIMATPPNYWAKTLIIATGAARLSLNLPGEKELVGRGLSYCATCDGPFFRQQPVAIVGGGNAALEEALQLTKSASQVHLIHRRTEFKADRHLQTKVQAAIDQGRIKFWPATQVTQLRSNGQKLTGLQLQQLTNNGQTQTSDLEVAGLFIAIGSRANSQLFADQLPLEPDGRLQTLADQVSTTQSGIWIAGDVGNDWQQLVTATATGALAAQKALEFLDQE